MHNPIDPKSIMYRTILMLIGVLSLTTCAGLNYVDVESTNQNSRVNYLVIHATSEYFDESLRLLSTRNMNPVSSHYLVPYLEDPTYDRNKLRIYRLVDENRRAWHAGISQWGNESSLNDRSIGIEVVNNFKCNELETYIDEEVMIDLECTFPSYPATQIDILVELINEILVRHPGIDPVDVVAHADIAPNRKSDPGPEFPWEQLYARGIGAWYDDETVLRYSLEIERNKPSVLQLQCALASYGYPIEITGTHDLQSQFAFRAFQLHYRAADFSGIVDTETAAILYALNEKYRGNSQRNCAEPSES
ncbi:MAG: N-acetylmuramoyl-L-alanine amidase [Gammaproteobacteria bacterium]|nr:N-acetylmuramoyl-L-alanine amidase [Gammaproteobacteria bacterium]